MLNGSAVSIRLASIDDVEAMTDLHCVSFKPEEHVPMALGRDYVKANYRWLVTNKHAYALCAEYEGKVVGLVAMCDASFTWPMFMACLNEFFISLLKNPVLLLNRRLWNRLFRRPDVADQHAEMIVKYPGVAQMTIGAVDDTIRGRSVFPKLISATKDYSKASGSRAIRAGVYNWNTPCRKAFIKDGWTLIPELATSDTVFFMAFLDGTIAKELRLEHRLNGCPSLGV